MSRRRFADVLGRGLLNLFHWSDEPREAIDPAMHLTNRNIIGAERDLANSAVRLTPFRVEPQEVYKPYPPQAYYGGEGYKKERGLGLIEHMTSQPREGFYDVSDDVDRFMPLANEKINDMLSDRGINMHPKDKYNLVTSEAMKMAKDAAYLGLSNRAAKRDVYTMFDAVVPDRIRDQEGMEMSILEYLSKVGKR